MAKKNIIQTIQSKEMDRKDFLKYTGIAIIGLVGLKGVANLISNERSNSNSISGKSNRGFGSGKYGA